MFKYDLRIIMDKPKNIYNQLILSLTLQILIKYIII